MTVNGEDENPPRFSKPETFTSRKGEFAMSASKLQTYVPADAARSAEYAAKFQKLIACQTVSVKGSHDVTEFAKFRDVVAEVFPLFHSSCEHMLFLHT